MSKIALIVEAHPRMLTESHPSFLPAGNWKVTADCATKLQVRRRSPLETVESIHAIGDVIVGECTVIVSVIEVDNAESRISAFAELVK